MGTAPKNIDTILSEAVQIESATERSAFLDKACGEDSQLRQRIDKLVRDHFRAGSAFLEEPPAAFCPTLDEPITEQPGTQIGPYKVLQQIGEGGMGVVYMAEQTEPVERRVALKIIKPGMDTRKVIARFEAERQALAMMDHPNIAKVLDAGTTDNGRPYFVMELVKGVHVTQYCDEKQLTPRARLELFVAICQAIQHAHQKGIIHRDIKPSNVLVAEYDDRPVPKIIDFGVAKAIEQRLTEKTVFTEFGQVVGTPEYMSPEQAKLNQLDIDTRTDIYSLGVLLYELLAGETPFDRERLRSAAFDELLRIIREEEPPRPSAKASTSQSLPTIAANRKTESKKLGALIRGELDWIVMKALEKDRTRRYETANGVARDIERFLQNEPVVACPPSTGYRFRKFAQRNKVVITTGAIIATTLIAATYVSMRQTTIARRAKQLAEAEAVRSTQVAQFLKDMLAGVGPGVAMGQDTKLLRGILDEVALRLETELTGQPEVEADLRETLGNVYRDLGEYSSAETMFEKSLELRRAIHGSEHSSVADSLQDLAKVYWLQYRNQKAEACFREALALRRQVLGAENLEVADSLHGLAEVLRREGANQSEAETVFREALAMRRKLLGDDSLEVATSLVSLGILLRNMSGRHDDAESCLREALEIRRNILGEEHPKVAYTLCNLGYLLTKMPPSRREEGESLLREALAIQRRVLGDHRDTAMTLHFLGSVVEDPEDAEHFHRQALEMRLKVLRPGHTDVIRSFENLIALLKEQGKSQEAAELLHQELEWRKQRTGEELPDGDFLIEQLNILLLQGNVAEAEALLREAPVAMDVEELNGRIYDFEESGHAQTQEVLSLARANMDHQVKWHSRKSKEAASAMIRYADKLRNWTRNKQPESESLAREALSTLQSLYAPDHELVGNAYGAIGNAFWSQHRWQEAEEAFREELRIAEGLKVPKSQDEMYWIYWHLGTTLNGQSRYSEAEEFLRKAVEARHAVRSDAHPLMIRVVYVLANNLQAQDKYKHAEAVYREELARRQEVPNSRELVNGRDIETASLQLRLGQVLLAQGRRDDGEAMIQEAAKQDAPEVLNALAWPLATDADPDQRDGETAVKLAERAVELTGRKSLGLLDTLAAAYAEAGQFDDAVRAQQEAISLLAEDQQNMRKEFQYRLGLFEAKTPYRDHNLLASWATELLRQGQAVQAEPLARECLKICEQVFPDSWRTFNAQSLLGGSLLQQGKYDEAEPLLISGYQGLAERADTLPSAARERPNEALERLVQFYENRDDEGDAEKAAELLGIEDASVIDSTTNH